MAGGELEEDLKIVLRAGFVTLFVPTVLATVADGVFPALDVYRDGFHEPLAHSRTVTGVYIDMLAPQALWTMVGVAIAHDGGTAVSAGKVFGISYKSGRHRASIANKKTGCLRNPFL